MHHRIVQPNGPIAGIIQELLELPDLKSATVILRTVLHTIKSALLRGEDVIIRGFGTFKIVTRQHRPTPNNILTNDTNGVPIAYSPELLCYTPRRVVVFEPSLPLRAMLNMDSPNYKERRTQRRWSQ